MDLTKKLTSLLAGAFLLSVSGCGNRAERPVTDVGGSTPSGILVSDGESLLRAELEQADRDFARNVRDTRLDGWVDAFAEDGMVLPAEGPVATGQSAIRELFAPLFAEPGFEIIWAPAGAEVAGSGDLGFTYGDWETSRPKVGADAEQAKGKYVTIWSRDSEGRWKVLLDIGNTQSATTANR